MRRLVTLSAATLFLALALPAAAQPARRARYDRAGEAAMLERINELRASQDLPPLTREPGLDEAARVHSEDMAAHTQLVHVSERTGTPAARVRGAGVEASRIGENIARHATTGGAFDAILGSEAHRAQLLEGAFTHIGLAALRAEDGIYVTQVLAVVPPPAELPPPAVEDAELPAPTVEEVPTAPETPEPAVEEVEVEDAVQDADVEVGPAVDEMPAADPLPRLRLPAGRRNVAGYWVHQQGRWWYFPVPAGAQPGQLILPDPSMEGPPPGYENGVQPQPMPGAQRVRPRRRVVRPRGRTGVLSPRRGGTIYWY
ncbi:MAG: hypothetical protein CMN30_25390 [Sandaracinus sp.]|nr:hypothetical protein [Sandaracinus sp.]